jgi:hypothetical protein
MALLRLAVAVAHIQQTVHLVVPDKMVVLVVEDRHIMGLLRRVTE